MKQFEIKRYRLDKGKHCFIHRGKLNKILAGKYGLDYNKTCIKVFDWATIKDQDDFRKATWGDDPARGEPKLNNTIFEATQIQNICNMYGFAPRVYGLETVQISGRLVPVQFCEYIKPKYPDQIEAERIYDWIIATLGKDFSFKCEKRDVSREDIIDGQLIDFQTLHFTKPYLDKVRDIYIVNGRYGKVYYQDEIEIGLTGSPRKSLDRIKYMNLTDIDFKGKDVLDVGCAGGFFLRYAKTMGARRCVGLDTPLTIHAPRHTNNYLGYFDIDIYPSGEDGEFEMPEVAMIQYDIIFFLSMYMHIGLPESVFNFLKPSGIMIFEKNGRESDEAVEKILKDKFSKVDLVGHGKDHGNKPIYLCIK